MSAFVKHSPRWVQVDLSQYLQYQGRVCTISRFSAYGELVTIFLRSVKCGERLIVSYLFFHAVRDFQTRNFVELFIDSEYGPERALSEFCKYLTAGRQGVTIEVIEYKIVSCDGERS